MRLVRPAEQKAEARERASALAGREAKWIKAVRETPKSLKKAMQREIARQKAIEAEAGRYITLKCDHYTDRATQEINEDGKHPALFFCEACYLILGEGQTEKCWQPPAPRPLYPSESGDEPPF